MKKVLAAFVLALMLFGCAAPSPVPAYYSLGEPVEITQRRHELTEEWTAAKARHKQLWDLLGKVTSPEDGAAIRAKIDDQQRQIEVLEEQMAQMPARESGAYISPNYSLGSSYKPAPCVAGTCGPVNVRGYYRKDGTYVRPHTRRSKGSGGRGRGRR